MLKSSYMILATIPGIPMIYYGDEAGLEGYSDPFNRMPYPWDNENKDLLDFYKTTGNIRAEYRSVYSSGEFRLLYITNDILVFSRNMDGISLLTCVNNSNNEIEISYSNNATSLLTVFCSNTHTLNPNSSDIYKITQETTIKINLYTKNNMMEN